MSKQSEIRILVKAAREAGCDGKHKTLAAILYSVNGLKCALEFVEFIRRQRAAEGTGYEPKPRKAEDARDRNEATI